MLYYGIRNQFNFFCEERNMLNHVLKFKKYRYAASGQLRGAKFVPFKWTSNGGGLAPELFFSFTMSYMFTRTKYQNLKDIWKLFIRLAPDLIKYLISQKPGDSHSLPPGGQRRGYGGRSTIWSFIVGYVSITHTEIWVNFLFRKCPFFKFPWKGGESTSQFK